MKYEGPREKKKIAKPKKKVQNISATEEEDAGMSEGAPSTSKGRPETDGKGQISIKEINNQIENTKSTSNRTPQEATLREQMGKSKPLSFKL